HADFIENEPKTLKAFLQATARGYQFAKNDPFAAAQILLETAPQLSATAPAFVEQSQVFIAQYYLDEQGKWGFMQNKIWKAFVDWLTQYHILNEESDAFINEVNVYQFFSNEFL
ncbi:MAG: ABC transporter substrate-binding protein, partial [Saprospiraceae bacterium]